MKKVALVLAVLCACGGTEASINDGGADSPNPNVDSGNPGDDSGMMMSDSGTGMDTGPTDDGGGTNDGGNDGGMMGFDPGQLSCLVLWLDAAKGVTQNNNLVSKWDDQSGKGNHANQAVMQRMPTLAMNAINNLPAIHFNQGSNQSVGNQLVINDSTSMRWGTGDFAVWVVARYNNLPNSGYATGTGLFFSKQNQNQQPGILFRGNYFNGGVSATAGLEGAIDGTQANTLDQPGNYNDNMPRSYGYRRSGSMLELRVNGMSVATKQQTGMVNVDSFGSNVRIGADGDATYRRLNGDIAEIIACAGMISMQDVANTEAYIKAKYNL